MGVSVRLLVVLVGALLPAAAPATPLVSGNVATNEIVEAPLQENPDLPYCRSGSACGYVQVNAYGVNGRHFCRCGRRTGGACSLQWDPEDGRSVTMGSDQFKFCESPPPLHVCGREETAYTAAFLFNKATFSMAGEQHLLHCFCPPPLAHARADMLEDVVDGELIMATVHTCSRVPACGEGSPCKEVSVGGGTALVNRKCRCGRGSACPTLTPTATPHSNSYPEGAAYSVHCLPVF